jgi:hypothetical protein
MPQNIIHDVTGFVPRVQTRILPSNRIRTLHHEPDSGPDPRERERTLTRQDTSVISDFLEDLTIPLDEKDLPWLNIIEHTGVELPQITHSKPSGTRTINSQTI